MGGLCKCTYESHYAIQSTHKLLYYFALDVSDTKCKHHGGLWALHNFVIGVLRSKTQLFSLQGGVVSKLTRAPHKIMPCIVLDQGGVEFTHVLLGHMFSPSAKTIEHLESH